MNIKYRIIKVDEAEHTFVVRYYTDIITEQDLSADWNNDGTPVLDENGIPNNCRTDFNLTIFDVNATPEAIDHQIRLSAPAEWLKLQESLKAPKKNRSEAVTTLLDKLHKEESFEHAPPSIPKALTADEVNELLAKLKPDAP